MKSVLALKEAGNTAYLKGCRIFPDDDCIPFFREACICYGKAVEEMISIESDTSSSSESLSGNDEFHILKPTLFVNLAASNLKLNAIEGCRRCCNSCILFCNNPSLPLSEMGVDQDVTVDLPILEPVLPSFAKLACKALYRRGKCHMEIDAYEPALSDFLTAIRLNPDDKELLEAAEEARSSLTAKTTNSVCRY